MRAARGSATLVGATLLAAACLLATRRGSAAGAASATECHGWGPRNAISERPFAFTSLGLGAQYERFALPPRWSIAGSFALRTAAHGDFAALSTDAGGELRFWITGKTFGRCLGERSMVGPFAAARLDLERTSLTSRIDHRDVGATWTLGDWLLLGYRVVLWRVVEVSVMAGAGFYTELDASGLLAPVTLPGVFGGFTYGWLF
ncbi:MAG TPA: hypothetical protein VIF15_02535 [Polyangiaceae bacterium]|jgi:hypothetical protein